MAAQHQIPPAQRLGLPHVHQLVNEMRLAVKRRNGEIVTVAGAIRVEIEVTHRRHGYITRMERKELAPPDSNRCEVDCITEYAPCQHDFAGREGPFSADWACRRGALCSLRHFQPGQQRVQRSSPAARTAASKLWVVLSESMSVTLTVSPGVQAADGCIAIT